MKRELIRTTLLSILVAGQIFIPTIKAQTSDIRKEIGIKAIPFPLEVINSPVEFEFAQDSAIKITAKGQTNLFNSPGKNFYRQNAPMVLFQPDSNFFLSARVTADLKDVYDVAALVIYQHKDLWAKLCFENSINREATVVSVVTREFSDDCNSIKISDDFVYLAIVKKGKEFSFHCSTDNMNWEMVRHFRLELNEGEYRIGFVAHCSVAETFSAEFSEINYSTRKLEHMRSLD